MELVAFSLFLACVAFSNAAVSVRHSDPPPPDTEDIYQLVHDMATQFYALKNDYETFRVEDKAAIEFLKSEMRQIQQQNEELQHSLETQRQNHNLQLKDIHAQFDSFKADLDAARSEDVSTISSLKNDISLVKQQNEDLRNSLIAQRQMQNGLQIKYETTASELRNLSAKTDEADSGIFFTTRSKPLLEGENYTELPTIREDKSQVRNDQNQTNDEAPKVNIPPGEQPVEATSRASSATVVAFHAYISNDHSSFGDAQTIIFDRYIANIGNNYNHYTGVFTCSVSGAYVFTWVMEGLDEKSIITELVRNGAKEGYLIVEGSPSSTSTSSQTVVVSLNVDDIVMVRVSSGSHEAGVKLRRGSTTFTGFRLN